MGKLKKNKTQELEFWILLIAIWIFILHTMFKL